MKVNLKKPKIKLFITCSILILTFIATYIKITQGFDIDESYAISMGLRLHLGDKLIFHLWDPYQFSAIFLHPFLDIFSYFKADLSQIVFFTRIASAIVDSIVTFVFYKFLKRETKNNFLSFIIAICYFNFLPKQIQNIDHATTLVWFTTLFSICLLEFCKLRKNYLLILSAIFYCGMILSYPTQLFLFPIILFGITKFSNQKSRDILSFSITCIFIGIITIVIVNPIYLLQYVKFIAMDGSHDFTILYHANRVIREFIRLLIYMIPLLMVSKITCKLFQPVDKRTSQQVFNLIE